MVGFSLGGIIAQSIGIEHPARVQKLALVSAIAAAAKKSGAKRRSARAHWRKAVPGAELRLLPNLKHSVLLEAPELVASNIAAFLSKKAAEK
ncbi:MAG: hypothetical protein JWN13_4380 [Betaproteobacteria bacterium]|nr:hypothetical protein [Betaproteobacteria bacterium]